MLCSYLTVHVTAYDLAYVSRNTQYYIF